MQRNDACVEVVDAIAILADTDASDAVAAQRLHRGRPRGHDTLADLTLRERSSDLGEDPDDALSGSATVPAVTA